MRQGEPAAELTGRFPRGVAVKGHRRGGAAGDARDLRAPFTNTDGRDLDSVLPAVDSFFETMQFHGWRR